MSNKIQISPDKMLQLLLDSGFVVETLSGQYRIATDPKTDRPYTLTAIVLHFKGFRSGVFLRELKKCLSEYRITYLSLVQHANLRDSLKYTKLKWIQDKLNVDVSTLTHLDRKRLSAYIGKYRSKGLSEEELLTLIKDYLDGKFGDLTIDDNSVSTERIDSILADMNNPSSSEDHLTVWPTVWPTAIHWPTGNSKRSGIHWPTGIHSKLLL